MRLVFYQPVVWIRLLKLIQQMYLRNDVRTQLHWSLHHSQGLTLCVKNDRQQLVFTLSPYEFKCWDVPANFQCTFSHLPLDWMLQLLQRFESMMNQKNYSAIGLVWEWRFVVNPNSGKTLQESIHNISWGPHSTMFQMCIRRNDTMAEIEPVNKNGNNNNNLAAAAAAAAEANNNLVNGNDLIHTTLLFGQKTTEVDSGPPAADAICTYWQDVVYVDPSPTMPLVLYEKFEAQQIFHVLPDELRRMLSEWLLLPPLTRIQFTTHGIEIQSGDCRSIKGVRYIPYHAHVFRPSPSFSSSSLICLAMEFNAQVLMDLHRFIHCVPSEWISQVNWKCLRNNWLELELELNDAPSPCGVPLLFSFATRLG